MRPPPNNHNNYNNYIRQPTNYNVPENNMTCTYCKRQGHDIAKCYKKQNDDRINNSGNLLRSDEMSGARPINLIADVEEEQHDAYTLCQS